MANWRIAARGAVLTSRPSGRLGLGSHCPNGSGHTWMGASTNPHEGDDAGCTMVLPAPLHHGPRGRWGECDHWRGWIGSTAGLLGGGGAAAPRLRDEHAPVQCRDAGSGIRLCAPRQVNLREAALGIVCTVAGAVGGVVAVQ